MKIDQSNSGNMTIEETTVPSRGHNKIIVLN